jgi:hypothetical protein
MAKPVQSQANTYPSTGEAAPDPIVRPKKGAVT